MLGPKALLLAGGESTFTLRAYASDENGYNTWFSGTLTYGNGVVMSVFASTSSPFESVAYLDRYNGSIDYKVESSTYPVYKITVEKNAEVVKTALNSTAISADMVLEPGDVVDIRVRTNSSS